MRFLKVFGALVALSALCCLATDPTRSEQAVVSPAEQESLENKQMQEVAATAAAKEGPAFGENDCLQGPNYMAKPAMLSNTTELDKCNLCQRIVENGFRWNWREHYDALCAAVPAHLMPLCKHYACHMASSCPEFITQRCVADNGARFPCPAKYVCWNCLQVPAKQVAGCFDGSLH
eukprot:PLAT2011.1.p1 GENE.PLAT2011.1~~PLAT2011.1.p1  ORF type:complete len:176 (+),score=45.18 PLAT2011.1:22-549(+)